LRMLLTGCRKFEKVGLKTSRLVISQL